MNKAVEADFEKAVRDYYAKSINMVKKCQEAFKERDRYRNEGLRQNALVKQLLAKQEQLNESMRDIKRKYQSAEEARLNNQELYEIARDEAGEAVKAQKALERIIDNMEAEQHPQRVRMQELEGKLQRRDQTYSTLEKSHNDLKAEHEAINTLFQLKRDQLDSTMQANRVLEARISSTSSSYTGSTSREQELEQQLSLQKTLVEAQRLESYNLYGELQQAKAEILALKEAVLTLPIPTQQSQPVSRGASTSTSMPRTT